MGKKKELVLVEKDEDGRIRIIPADEMAMLNERDESEIKASLSSWAAREALKSKLDTMSGTEVRKFVDYAKEQGMKMSFADMEKGIINAGHMDMKKGLEEIANSIKPDIPCCSECGNKMESHGRSKKKVLTSVGYIVYYRTLYICKKCCSKQVAYPADTYIRTIEYEVILKDKTKVKLQLKCTRTAGEKIALVVSTMPYEKAIKILFELTGINVDKMTAHRATNSIAAETVKEPLTKIDTAEISEITEKMENSILKARVADLEKPENIDSSNEIIREAIENKPDGVYYKDYKEPTKKTMYVMGDGTGIPGRREELKGIKGKQSDGSAKTFEAKVGTAFIVECTLDGRPLLTKKGEIYRDREVYYIGTTKGSKDFGAMLYQYALDNGLKDMNSVVFIGDGAKWLWKIQEKYFPYALPLIDKYHAIEHVNSMIDLLQFKRKQIASQKGAFSKKCVELLSYGKVDEMIKLISEMPCKKSKKKTLEKRKKYFTSNIDKMKYGIFKACGIYVGSGVVEAACKSAVGDRMKRAGMHWAKRTGNNMVSLQCSVLNDVFQKALPFSGERREKKVA